MSKAEIIRADFTGSLPEEKTFTWEGEEKFRRTQGEWEKFVGGQGVDKNIIPADIEDSWIRSKKYKIDPLIRPRNHILEEKDFQNLLNQNEALIESSLPFMENLHRFVDEYKFIVSLFDREGIILALRGDDCLLKVFRQGWVTEGASWREEEAGTNGIGTVVEIRRPVHIYGGQHYCRDFHRHTAYGAPIFDPRGEFIGGIVLTARYDKIRNSYLGMTVAAAKAIENDLRVQKALTESHLANSFQKTVIASIPEALITIDNHGFISLINESAKKMFSLGYKRVEGKHIRSVFGVQNERFLNLLNHSEALTDTEVRIFLNNQANDYTLTSNPILNHSGEMIGKILIINEIKRARTLVTNMIGARAKFRFDEICGNNPRFLETIHQARMVSQSSSNVLLLGKSGTGKDLMAQAIHNASGRGNGPYVAINCAAIPRDLITSELFGYTEGAFTGSRRGGSQGKFELADGGTIFLDEIAETPLELQAVLLRVIEDKSITRIGGKRVRPVDVRIIAATNKDLKEEIRKGTFREDLYYRLNVFTIQMVPLSERLDDIPLLVDLFVNKTGRAMGKKVDRIDGKIVEAFMKYPWPGNVRELQNVIERMMNYVTAQELTVDLIPAEILRHQQTLEIRYDMESPKDVEFQMLVRMLGMNLPKKEIARKMKIARSSLYRKLRQYKLG